MAHRLQSWSSVYPTQLLSVWGLVPPTLSSLLQPSVSQFMMGKQRQKNKTKHMTDVQVGPGMLGRAGIGTSGQKGP